MLHWKTAACSAINIQVDTKISQFLKNPKRTIYIMLQQLRLLQVARRELERIRMSETGLKKQRRRKLTPSLQGRKTMWRQERGRASYSGQWVIHTAGAWRQIRQWKGQALSTRCSLRCRTQPRPRCVRAPAGQWRPHLAASGDGDVTQLHRTLVQARKRKVHSKKMVYTFT